MIYYWWIRLFSTCPHRPLQFGRVMTDVCQAPQAAVEVFPPKESNGVQRKWWCHAGGPGQKGSVASLNHRLNPWKLYKASAYWVLIFMANLQWLVTQIYLQCSCRKRAHASPSPSTSSWNRKIGHNPSTEHRVPRRIIADCLPMAHKHQRGWTTLQAQLCHEADPQLGHNESSARHSRQSRHSSSTEESDGAKKSTLKFMQTLGGVRQASRGRGGGKFCKYMQVQCAMGPLPFWEREATPPPVPPPKVGRSIYIEISAGCNKSKGELTLPKVMQLCKW